MSVLYNPESPDNEAIRELRDELKDLNKSFKAANRSSERLTIAMATIAFVQFFTSLFQFMFEIIASDKRAYGWGVLTLLTLSVFIVIVFKTADRRIDSEDKKDQKK